VNMIIESVLADYSRCSRKRLGNLCRLLRIPPWLLYCFGQRGAGFCIVPTSSGNQAGALVAICNFDFARYAAFGLTSYDGCLLCTAHALLVISYANTAVGEVGCNHSPMVHPYTRRGL